MKRGRKPKDTDFSLSDNEQKNILTLLKKTGAVSIGGLGRFEIIKIKPRTLFHNTAQKEITTKGHNKLKYTPTKTLKSYIND